MEWEWEWKRIKGTHETCAVDYKKESAKDVNSFDSCGKHE